jgi:hypothetical protein
MTETLDLSELKKQYQRHMAAVAVTRDRWLREVGKSPDHAKRTEAETAFKDAMAALDLDIDLLWRAAAEGEIPTD